MLCLYVCISSKTSKALNTSGHFSSTKNIDCVMASNILSSPISVFFTAKKKKTYATNVVVVVPPIFN